MSKQTDSISHQDEQSDIDGVQTSDSGLVAKPSEENQVEETLDTIEKLPRHEQELLMAKLEMYSGPIPHPNILERYEQIDPGAAKQIIDNGISETKHRQSFEDKSLEYMRRDRKRRDWMGFMVALVIIGVGALLIYFDHYIAGSILSGGSALGVVGLFLGGDSNSNTKKNINKDENDPQAKQ